MGNLKTVLFFIVSTLLSFNVSIKAVASEGLGGLPNLPSTGNEAIDKRNFAIYKNNFRAVFDQGESNVAKSHGIPANIDNQVRSWILEKFGGVEIIEYGDRVERELPGGVISMPKNLYGKKYNDYQYYVYKFWSNVTRTNSTGGYKESSGYEFELDVIMNSNGEINEYKWTEKRR